MKFSAKNIKLSFITVPIGNLDDITLRALNCLREAQVLMCEEPRKSRQWLTHWGIKFYQGQFDKNRKDLYLFRFDKNCDSEELSFIKDELIPFSKYFAFISGAGCPMFHDPGNLLMSVFQGVKKDFIPGVSSLGTLLMHVPNEVQREGFEVYGFLPRKKFQRDEAWSKLSNIDKPVFLMETAYRLPLICNELEKFAEHHHITFGYALTKPNQQVISGSVQSVLPQIKKLSKDDFVIFLSPNLPIVSKESKGSYLQRRRR